MKRLFIFAMIMLFALQAVAGTLTGRVTDAESGDPVAGANALLLGTALGAAADKDGRFEIRDIPDGTYTLQVQAMGFEKMLITGIEIKGKTPVVLNIRINPSTLEGSAVTTTVDRVRQILDEAGKPAKGLGAEMRKHSDSPEKPAAPGDFGGGVLTEAGEHLKKSEMDKEDSGLYPVPSEVSTSPMRSGGPSGSSGLKAGFSDDNKQFNYFVNFLEKYKSTTHFDLPVGERIIITVKDGAGRSLPNTDIEILAGGKTIARGKTYPDGTWMFHPSAFEGDTQSFLVKAVSGGTSAEWTIPRQGRREMDGVLQAQKRAVQSVPLDILFILDTTGSMGEEIERLKKTIELINLNLASLASKPAVRFGMVLYRDRGDDYVTRIVPFTEKLDLFQAALAPVRANGGGDGPEDLQSALKDAVQQMSWNTDGIRLGFIITDAPPHLDYGQEYTYVDAARDGKEKGIKLLSVGTGGLDIAGEYVLRQISQYTQAKYIFLTYGERGESEGGRAGSVSHHTGDNYQTDKLEAIVIQIAKEEIGFFTDTPPEKGEDYFAAQKLPDETREETLKNLFSMAASQLADYSTIRLAEKTPSCLIPVPPSDEADRKNAEYFSEQLLLALNANPVFKLVERKNLQEILDELKLSQSALVDEKKAVEAGKLTGAELLVMGTLFRMPEAFEMFLKLLRTETGEILSVTKMRIDTGLGL